MCIRDRTRFIFHDDEDNSNKPSKGTRSRGGPATTTTTTTTPRRTKRKRDTWSYNVSSEDAVKEQERLLEAAAARVRNNQTKFRVTTATAAADEVLKKTINFTLAVEEIEIKYPSHWQFQDPYARLGLPRGANQRDVKSQYRRLALVYHPDKSRIENTAIKFQAVTEAYRLILGR